ncbi:hypothetical protein ACFQ7F_42510 [Streptomyces sp. NPDC056486]|uniref:hypothetical protein n=1 Tax=Streptomyces sp. NPDC056486 TaxID=3345835 RepID=UPI0036B0608E
MVALTPLGSLPYPQPADNADIPVHLQSLAEAVDGRTVLRFADGAARDAKLTDPIPGMVAWLNNPGRFYYFAADKRWTALVPGPSHWYISTAGTTTSAAYVETLTGATPPLAVTATAPPSGTLLITVGARISNSSANLAYLSASVKQGATVVSAAADTRAAIVGGTNQVSSCIQYPVSGLTPGVTYTFTGAYRSAAAANTATFANRFLTITPMV